MSAKRKPKQLPLHVLKVRHIGHSVFLKLPPEFKVLEDNAELHALIRQRRGRLYYIIVL